MMWHFRKFLAFGSGVWRYLCEDWVDIWQDSPARRKTYWSWWFLVGVWKAWACSKQANKRSVVEYTTAPANQKHHVPCVVVRGVVGTTRSQANKWKRTRQEGSLVTVQEDPFGKDRKDRELQRWWVKRNYRHGRLEDGNVCVPGSTIVDATRLARIAPSFCPPISCARGSTSQWNWRMPAATARLSDGVLL